MPHDIDFFDCDDLNGPPSEDPAAGAEVHALAHETEETNTDEDLNAWYDNAGNENADKCAWDFGATYTTSNGSTANMQVGGSDFLVQQNWVNANGGGCRLRWETAKSGAGSPGGRTARRPPPPAPPPPA